MAAYRLARKRGIPHDTAVKKSADMNRESHFDYTNTNRARLMRSNSAKLFLMFKSYSQHMIYHMMRNAHLWGKGDKKAKAKLLGVLTVTLAMGGVSAMPIGIVGLATGATFANAKYGTKKTVQGAVGIAGLLALASLMWDDEEPFDWETETRAALRAMGGDSLEAFVFRGAINAATGLNVSGRISLKGLLIREPNRELEGKDLATHYIEQALGPVVGYAASTATAWQLAKEDHGYRAVERLMPVFAKNLMKAGRYGTEGVLNMRGDAVVKKDLLSLSEDLNMWNVIGQAAGFSPEKVGRQYQKTNDIKGYEAHIKRRKQRILARYYMAYLENDKSGMEDVISAAQKWNQANPKAKPINAKTLRRSLKTRLRYREDSVNGASVQKGYRYLVQELNAA